MQNAWPVHQWNRADVQSVGGGFVVVNESIRFYSSGSKDLPFGEKTAHYHSRGNKSTGMAYLRRDGFTSVRPHYQCILWPSVAAFFDCTVMVSVCYLLALGSLLHVQVETLLAEPGILTTRQEHFH